MSKFDLGKTLTEKANNPPSYKENPNENQDY